jgi:acyl-CoA reductase-like NAD-dependent aldehyde dehydrogenase
MELIAKLVPQYLDNKAIIVVEDAVEETTQLLNEKFDHIMYTGNGAVARIVMQAASKYLTPVTLELGGGEYDIENKFMEPTLVLVKDLDCPLMKEEIFGPILPIVVVDDFAQAKNYVIEHDKPLAAYLFTKNKMQEQQWINEIQAGSQGINDVIMFNAVPDLSFGGKALVA